MVVAESWSVLQRDKEILWFPVLSGAANIVLMVIAGLAFFILVLNGDTSILASINAGNDAQVDAYFANAEAQTGLVPWTIGLLYYVASFFVVNFFQAGVMLIASARFRGENLNLADGMSGAFRRIGKIFAWSLISATVGVILNQIFERSQILGKIVATLLGAAWTILTFFSLPSLVLGNTSIPGSFSESASIIRKTWGETVIVNVGVSLFFALLMLVGVVVFFGFLIFFVDYTLVPVLLVAALVLYLIGLMVVASALSSIFKTALYEYAKTGQVPSGFSPELIKSAISRR